MDRAQAVGDPSDRDTGGEPLPAGAVRRRPMIGLSLAYIAGTWLGLNGSGGVWLPLAGGALVWLAAAALVRRPARAAAAPRRSAVATLALHACVLCAAWALAAVFPNGGTVLRRLTQAGFGEGQAAIKGMVAQDPDFRRNAQTGRYVWSFPLELQAVRDAQGHWHPASGSLRVTLFTPASARPPSYGELWHIGGRINPLCLREFEEDDTYLKACRITADAHDARFVSAGHGNGFRALCYDCRRRSAALLERGLTDIPGAAALPRALMLGYRLQVTPDMQDLFTATGTLHVVAISGTHVMLFTGMVIFMLRLLRLPRTRWALLLAPLLVVYAVTTGGQASVVRACVMAVAFFLAPLLGRRPDGLSSVAFAAVLILIASPVQLVDLGFMLSFVAVVGLIVLYPVLERPVRRLWEPDPMRVQAETARARMGRDLLRHVGQLVLVSVAAWLTTTPIIAYAFGRFTPLALFANVVVVPLAFLSVIAGCLSLVAGSCVAWFAVVFNHANYAICRLMLGSMAAMVHAPFGSVRVAQPPLWAVWLWYALLGLALLAHQQWRLARARAAASKPA